MGVSLPPLAPILLRSLHWQIENGLHWVRDVTFAEDLSQVHAGNSPQVMASLPVD
jgi:predicted transposase YbfD/YdcC